jgi:hypothetical protein
MTTAKVRVVDVIDTHHVEGYDYNINIKAVPVERYGLPSYTYQLTKDYADKSWYQYIKELSFQVGDPKVYGVNGVTNEALLAIMIHRLQRFQDNPKTHCVENNEAIFYMKSAIDALYTRQRRLEVADQE